MALTEIVYRHLSVITNKEEIEWVSLEACLAEIAEAKAKKKLEKKQRRAMNRAVKREKNKLKAARTNLAKAKYAAFKERTRR